MSEIDKAKLELDQDIEEYMERWARLQETLADRWQELVLADKWEELHERD